MSRRKAIMSCLALKIARGKVRNIEEAVEELPEEVDQEASQVKDDEELVRETISTIEVVKRRAEPCDSVRRQDATPEQVAYAHIVGFLLTRVIQVLPRVQDITVETRPPGHELLASLGAELAAIKSRLAKQWLLPDSAKIEIAKKELAEGRFRTI